MSSEGSEVVRLEQRTPFTMVDNPIIRALDDYVALGLYVDMLSWPPGWRINLRELSRTHRQGRTVLTAAMNELIERGLVFRVRYQQAGGQWMTRTYVCASPVTVDELLNVRSHYLGRCRIETSAELTEPANRPGQKKPTAAQEPAGESAEATPSTRFSAPGTPAVGNPTAGQPKHGPRTSRTPTVRRPARQRSDPKPKTPPPTSPSQPDDAGAVSPAPDSATRGATATAGNDWHGLDRQLASALLASWPALTESGLAQLAGELAAAATTTGMSELTQHLTANTAGALNPVAVLRSRLRNVPQTPLAAQKVPWCGQCASPSYRWLEDADGYPLRACPACSGQARADQLSKS